MLIVKNVTVYKYSNKLKTEDVQISCYINNPILLQEWLNNMCASKFEIFPWNSVLNWYKHHYNEELDEFAAVRVILHEEDAVTFKLVFGS